MFSRKSQATDEQYYMKKDTCYIWYSGDLAEGEWVIDQVKRIPNLKPEIIAEAPILKNRGILPYIMMPDGDLAYGRRSIAELVKTRSRQQTDINKS